MAAPKHNEYYKLRSKHGRDRIFQSPEELATTCNEYFQWCLNNPLTEEIAFHNRGEVVTHESPKMRAFTLEGLCNFIDIAVSTFQEYEKREGFSVITTRARQIIYCQKLEGAAAGLLNSNIIARELGLSDKNTHRFEDLSDSDLDRIIAKLKGE